MHTPTRKPSQAPHTLTSRSNLIWPVRSHDVWVGAGSLVRSSVADHWNPSRRPLANSRRRAGSLSAHSSGWTVHRVGPFRFSSVVRYPRTAVLRYRRPRFLRVRCWYMLRRYWRTFSGGLFFWLLGAILVIPTDSTTVLSNIVIASLSLFVSFDGLNTVPSLSGVWPSAAFKGGVGFPLVVAGFHLR